MGPTIGLITGTNRGIGNGILELYLAKPNHTVIAANHNPNHVLSKAIVDLPKAQGTSLLLIKLDATMHTDPTDAVKSLESNGIDNLDILIANTGIAYIWPKVSEVKVEDLQKHILNRFLAFISPRKSWLVLSLIILTREFHELLLCLLYVFRSDQQRSKNEGLSVVSRMSRNKILFSADIKTTPDPTCSSLFSSRTFHTTLT